MSTTPTPTLRSIKGGLLVAIEGIDGAGKTTQARALRQFFGDLGYDVVQTHEPTNGQWGTLLRASAQTGRLEPEEELELFLRDRQEHVTQLLEPALARGAVVIVDRYYFSTAAYQGARGFDAQELITRNEAFAPRPHLLVVLDIDPVQGLERVSGRGDVANEFEREEGLRAARAIFRTIEGDDVLHVDALHSQAEVTASILARLHQDLFTRLCLKGYEPRCEPVYCGVREQCDYHSERMLVELPEHDPVQRPAQDP